MKPAMRMIALCLGFSVLSVPLTAHATLIDIGVIAIWESTNVDTTINPFGIVNGDMFYMNATYDDASFFNGADGVTASLDPGVNVGASFELIIPTSAGDLVFDHNDHISIGFAPMAQIEFDGTDSTTDPGMFRNFEIHIEFAALGQQFQFDIIFIVGAIEADLFNASQSFNLAAMSGGSDFLQVASCHPVPDCLVVDPPQSVPEPSTLGLLGAGLLGLFMRRKRAA